MNRKKTLAVAIVLALVLLIGGMLAYFTDTATKENKFKLGEMEIKISISEASWDNLTDGDGKVGTPGTTSNGIPDIAEDIIPGATIAKDPVINNNSTTNSACVFAEIVVPALAADKPIFTYNKNAGWVEVGEEQYDATEKTITHVYAYGTSSEMTELTAGSSTTTAIFSSVTFNTDLTATDLASIDSAQQIDVNAYGIQYANLDSYAPDAVWALAH